MAARLLDRAKQRIHQEDGTRADERPMPWRRGGQEGCFFLSQPPWPFGLSTQLSAIFSGNEHNPSWGSSENHRLKYAFKKGDMLIPWEGKLSTFLGNDILVDLRSRKNM